MIVRLTRFTSHNGPLTKRLYLSNGDNGDLRKEAAAELVEGVAEQLAIDFNDFGGLLSSLSTDQAISFGVTSPDKARVLSEREWNKAGRPADAILRKRKHFTWGAGPGVLMLDYDAPAGAPLSGEALRAALYQAMPAIESAAHFWWPSAGSLIWNGQTEISGLRGQRLYVLVNDAAEIPRIGNLIAARLWLCGLGRFVVSLAGSLLERTLVDTAVWQPERLDFAAGALCSPPLKQHRGAPVRFGGGDPLDARGVADLTREESASLAQIKAEQRQENQSEADAVKERWINDRGQQISMSRKVPVAEGVRIARVAVECRRLYGDFALVTENGDTVAVSDLLANREKWHGARFCDPLEGSHYPDNRIAWANLAAVRPYIYSHAHGGARFTLHRARLIIEVGDGNTAEATEAALKYLRDEGSYFARGDGLVRVDECGAMERVGSHGLRHRLALDIQFEKFKAREKRKCPADCPLEIPVAILDMRGAADLPPLRGVSRWPTMTPTGKLLDRPGYDAQSHTLFVESDALPWPQVPRDPTPENVRAALYTAYFPVRLFPYTDSVSRAVTLAAMFTAVLRKALPTAPGFLFAAPSAGTGKTLLAECIVELAGGGAAIALPDSEAEISKTLIAKLRAGASAIFFDNITRGLDSASLNAMLTAETFDGRVLGVSDMTGPLPTNALVVATGNNAAPVGDACRRILVATIDAKTEKPYTRQFDFSPLAHVRAHKSAIIGAVLTVMQGFVRAGMPQVAPGRLASFEQWDALIRQAVVWAGQIEAAAMGEAAIGFGDPAAGIEAQYDADEDTAALRVVLRDMEAEQDGHGYLAGELYRLIEAARRGVPGGLGGALLNAMPQVQSSKGVGRWLKRMQGRVVGGLRVVGRADSATNSTRWRVVRA